ncbi:M10L1 helicase, partial [Sterrhoptilus dennistouni]|nr:M10L1 helicase [Sterrhoptilus dennistouni]
LVNTIVVESSQSCYIWRALCLVPVSEDGHGVDMQLIFHCIYIIRDKGELKISRMTDFGTLKQGESKRLIIWIQNKGSVPQSLISCKLAGWVKAKQFSVEIPQKCENSSSSLINQENLSKAAVNSFNNSGGTACESLNHTSIMRNGVISDENMQNGESEQKDHVDQPVKHSNTTPEIVIPPGEKIFIVIVCTAVIRGYSKELLLLGFSDFTVGRYIEATVTCEEELLIAPVQPYS